MLIKKRENIINIRKNRKFFILDLTILRKMIKDSHKKDNIIKYIY